MKELFGPIIHLIPFTDLKEALKIFNGTEFIDLMSEPDPKGFEAQGLVGDVSIKIAGDIIITL